MLEPVDVEAVLRAFQVVNYRVASHMPFVSDRTAQEFAEGIAAAVGVPRAREAALVRALDVVMPLLPLEHAPYHFLDIAYKKYKKEG